MVGMIVAQLELGKLPAQIAVAGIEINQPKPLDHKPEPFHLADPALDDDLVVAFYILHMRVRGDHGFELATHGLELVVGRLGDATHEREQLQGFDQREHPRIVTRYDLSYR